MARTLSSSLARFKQVSIFGVQPAGPSVHALRPVEPNNCDALGVDFVLRVLQFHIYSACSGAGSAADIQIGLFADTVVAANVLQKPHVGIVDAFSKRIGIRNFRHDLSRRSPQGRYHILGQAP